MSRSEANSGFYLRNIDHIQEAPLSLNRIVGALRIRTDGNNLDCRTLPFAQGDTTARRNYRPPSSGKKPTSISP
jgi:hypothetical protein